MSLENYRLSLEVKLRKKLNNFKLDINFSAKNELTVLFGPSGAGKSITLGLIAGLLNPDEGEIQLAGVKLFDHSTATNLSPQKRTIGYVFQNHSLFPHLTILENILFGARGYPKKKKQEMAQELIAKFGLQIHQYKYPDQISGGQKQKVALARAVIRRPRVLLLDEPFSSLDTPSRIEMRITLKNILQEFNIPIIMVTHDIVEAYSLADNMLVIIQGRIVEEGKPAEIFQKPKSPEVASYIHGSMKAWPASMLAATK